MDHEEKKETSHSHEAGEGSHTHHAHHEAVVPESTPVEKNASTKSKFSVLFFGIVGALAIAFLIFYGVLLSQVKKLSDHSFVLRSAEVLRIPAVKAQGETLLYTDYITDVNSLKKVSQNPNFGFGSATPQELSDLVVANFFTNIKVKEFAKNMNVQLTDQELAAKKAELFSEYGEESVKKNVQDSYGWDIDTFVKKILAPATLNAKVRAEFEKSTSPEAVAHLREQVNVSHILIRFTDLSSDKAKAENKKKAQGILARLKKGEDFATLAKEFSDDPGSKEQGGSLGWVARGATVPEFEKVAFSIPLNKLSDLVESEYGYHIIKVSEKRNIPNYEFYMDSEVKKLQPKFYIPIHNPLENLPAPAVTTSTPETK